MSPQRIFILLGLMTAACASTGPDPADRITVAVTDTGAMRGVSATYRVDASLGSTTRAILHIEARPEKSDLVVQARSLERGEIAGRSLIWLNPTLGLTGRAVYQYRIDHSTDRQFRYDFQVVSEGGTWRVAGSYTVRPDGDGSIVVYEFTSTLAALPRDRLLTMIRKDASRIMARAE